MPLRTGGIISLRGDLTIENVDPIEISKNVTLELNRHTLSKSTENALLRILGSDVAITNSTVKSTCVSKSADAVVVGKLDRTGAKLTLDKVTPESSVGGGFDARGYGLTISAENEAVVEGGTYTSGVYTEGTLTMSGGDADRLRLGMPDDIKVAALSGGSFRSIQRGKDIDYQSLLAEGYAYQKQDGALVKLSEMDENTAVTVVKCSHQDDPSGGGVCPYCGYAATVTKTDGSISYHRTTDEAIAAADGGTVTKAGWSGAYGYRIVIDHGGGFKTLYAHCSSISVSAGQRVYQGQKIGAVGNTGRSTGAHCHFEIFKNGANVNPASYL